LVVVVLDTHKLPVVPDPMAPPTRYSSPPDHASAGIVELGSLVPALDHEFVAQLNNWVVLLLTVHRPESPVTAASTVVGPLLSV